MAIKVSSVRRPQTLVTFWRRGSHWVHDFESGLERECGAHAFSILDAASGWVSVAELRSRLNVPDLDGTIASLIDAGLLVRYEEPLRQRSIDKWEDWNPAAGFFHSVSRAYVPDALGEGPLLVESAPPPPLKSYRAEPDILLPPYQLNARLDHVLSARRTWRQFGDRALTVGEIAALLGTTFRVERWMELDEEQRVALKTSPSGGARHSIEAYLVALRVDGIPSGTYHYAPDEHALTLLPSQMPAVPAEFLPGQPGFHGAAAIVFMTSVFARMQWKYSHAHAYRVVYLDAGHLGQTFALAATALGLAPFQTAAMNSSVVDTHIGIDGISESVVYALGVGARPPGRDWAHRHDQGPNPRLIDPGWTSRLQR